MSNSYYICNKKDMLLYAVTDKSWLNGESLYCKVEEALKGGATFVQYREKHKDREQFIKEAIEIKELCKKYNVPFVINDNVDIAKEIDADGVHVGQDDLEVSEARKILGPDKIIGVSAHNLEEALNAQKNGASYLGVGAVFSTNTKDDATCIKHETVKEICDTVSIPVVAIGGISAQNILQLKGTNVSGVAVISAIFAQPDITEAIKNLKKLSNQITSNY